MFRSPTTKAIYPLTFITFFSYQLNVQASLSGGDHTDYYHSWSAFSDEEKDNTHTAGLHSIVFSSSDGSFGEESEDTCLDSSALEAKLTEHLIRSMALDIPVEPAKHYEFLEAVECVVDCEHDYAQVQSRIPEFLTFLSYMSKHDMYRVANLYPIFRTPYNEERTIDPLSYITDLLSHMPQNRRETVALRLYAMIFELQCFPTVPLTLSARLSPDQAFETFQQARHLNEGVPATWSSYRRAMQKFAQALTIL
jgi:hypothetical protein